MQLFVKRTVVIGVVMVALGAGACSSSRRRGGATTADGGNAGSDAGLVTNQDGAVITLPDSSTPPGNDSGIFFPDSGPSAADTGVFPSSDSGISPTGCGVEVQDFTMFMGGAFARTCASATRTCLQGCNGAPTTQEEANMSFECATDCTAGLGDECNQCIGLQQFYCLEQRGCPSAAVDNFLCCVLTCSEAGASDPSFDFAACLESTCPADLTTINECSGSAESFGCNIFRDPVFDGCFAL